MCLCCRGWGIGGGVMAEEEGWAREKGWGRQRIVVGKEGERWS